MKPTFVNIDRIVYDCLRYGELLGVIPFLEKRKSIYKITAHHSIDKLTLLLSKQYRTIQFFNVIFLKA